MYLITRSSSRTVFDVVMFFTFLSIQIYQPFVLWIAFNASLPEPVEELGRTVNLERCRYGVPGLIENKVIKLHNVVFYPRLYIEPDPPGLLDQLLPIGLQGPSPFIGIGIVFIYISEIVQQHTPEFHADLLLSLNEGESPIIPELQLHSDPMLSVGQSSFCCLIINADQDSAFFAAMINRDTVTALITAIHQLLMDFGQPKLTDIFPVSRVLKKLLRIQYAGVIIKGYVQPGHVKASRFILKEPKETVKITAPQFLESTAALTGHLQAASHSLVTIVQNGDATIVQRLPVPIPAMVQFFPRNPLHLKEPDPDLRVIILTAYCDPIIQDKIFRNITFHNFLTPFV